MKHLAIADGVGLHPRVALPPAPGIPLKQVNPGNGAGAVGSQCTLHQAAQRPCIFQRHCCPLGQIWTHGVGCVARQGNAPLGVFVGARHGGAVVQRPLLPAGHRFQQVAQLGVHGADGLQQFGAVGVMGPALGVTQLSPFHHGHHVHQLATPNGVLHHMQFGTQPGRDALGAKAVWQVDLRHHAAVGNVPRKPGRNVKRGVGIGQQPGRTGHDVAAHHAPQAVAPDDGIGHMAMARFSEHAHAIG